ncbi:hypothetical protein ACFV5G_34225 [Streptomyces sp. NPDC059766]|uniref:hypothetical protein n=1 Tax=Streptomyces sp. NPDC059766 TaxID=3346940 RepID=UPI003656B05B
MNSTHAVEATLRGVGACCAVGNAVLHTLLVPDHLEEKFYIGLLFAVGSAVMLVVAAALVFLKHVTVAWLTGSLVSLGMIIGFLLFHSAAAQAPRTEAHWRCRALRRVAGGRDRACDAAFRWRSRTASRAG